MFSRKQKIGSFITAGLTTLLLVAATTHQWIVSESPQKNIKVRAQSIQPGDGLVGKYFQNWRCTDTSKTRIDPRIEFTDDSQFGTGYHDPCIIWTGQIYIETGTGDYTFYGVHDDYLKITVDNVVIYEHEDWTNVDRASDVVRLESKRRYDITVEFYDHGRSGYVTLKWSGPGLSKQVIPQRVLYSSRTECSDSVDNDGDGKIDWPDDPGCISAHSNRESVCGNNLLEPHNQEVCDGTDLGGKTCITEMGPGQLGQLKCSSNCKSFDTSQCSAPPACSDGIDNDGDGKIDFPEDPGCSSSDDDDETDPPITRPVTLPGSSGELSTTDGSLYPLGMMAGSQNNLFAKVQVGSGFEMVRMTPTTLPSAGGEPKNGSINYYLLQGKDSLGRGHLMVVPGRHWDTSVLSNPDLTPAPWFDLFATAKNLKECSEHIKQHFSADPFYLETPFAFQQLLEAVSLCQRGITNTP